MKLSLIKTLIGNLLKKSMKKIISLALKTSFSISAKDWSKIRIVTEGRYRNKDGEWKALNPYNDFL